MYSAPPTVQAPAWNQSLVYEFRAQAISVLANSPTRYVVYESDEARRAAIKARLLKWTCPCIKATYGKWFQDDIHLGFPALRDHAPLGLLHLVADRHKQNYHARALFAADPVTHADLGPDLAAEDTAKSQANRANRAAKKAKKSLARQVESARILEVEAAESAAMAATAAAKLARLAEEEIEAVREVEAKAAKNAEKRAKKTAEAEAKREAEKVKQENAERKATRKQERAERKRQKEEANRERLDMENADTAMGSPSVEHDFGHISDVEEDSGWSGRVSYSS